MMPAALPQLQSWFQSVVMHPNGVAAGLASPEAQREIDVHANHLETVVTRSETQTAAERLAIYARSYYLRLLECFRAEYPAVMHAVGRPVFDQFALAYLQRHPSRSYTLHDLGAGFARHLAETRPDAALPPEERESWPDFLIDMATLERAFVELYDGPGTEGQRLVTASDLRTLSPPRLFASKLETVPSLRLFEFRYPVDDYFRAIRQGKDPGLPPSAPTWLALNRRNYQVHIYRLDATSFACLQALSQGETITEAVRRGDEFAGARTPFLQVAKRLFDWAELGFFRSVPRHSVS